MTNIALDGDFAAARFTRGRAFLRWRGFRNTRVIAGGTGLLLIVICSVFGPWIAPREAEDTDFSDVLASPSLTSPLGTDHVGRDVFSRAIRGSKIALQVAIVTAAVGVTIGVTLGLTAGYIGGWTDRIIMTAIDTLLAFPALILILAMTAILGISLTNAMIAIGVVSVPLYARVTRGSVLVVRAQDFVLATHVLGASPLRTVARHVLPNILAPIVVLASLQVGNAILTEAGLSYLGLGAQAPTSSWGYSINQGRTYLQQAPWVIFGPGLFIFVTVISLNVLGDGLRDVTDPRLRGR